MQTFTQALTDSAYTELLNGGSVLAFDVNVSGRVLVVFNETAVAPAVGDSANEIGTWPDGWDFIAENMVETTQRIWVRAKDGASGVEVTGVRG
mgnify:CR=1 FL=1